MKRFLVFCLLGFGGCTHAPIVPVPQPTPSVTPSPPPTVSAPSLPTKVITLSCDDTCHSDERAQIPALENAINQTLLSSCFENYFKTPGKRLDNTNGLTPDRIVAKLREPASMTVNYFEKHFSREEGYESADDFSVIHMNRVFTSTWDLCYIASLAAHEFSHTKGFFHNGNLAAPNYFTIPYMINHAFEPKEDDDYNGQCCVNP